MDEAQPTRPPELSLKSTNDLLHAAESGDERAAALLVERWSARLDRWMDSRLPRGARTRGNSAPLVEELLRRRLVRHREASESRGLDSDAFCCDLRNAVLDRVREEIGREETRNYGEHANRIAARPSSPIEEAATRETVDRYDRALTRLAEGDRNCIIARVELGMSYDEIATELGERDAGAARMAVQRALIHLADEMRG
jgi:hypothetical protein